MFSIHSTSSDRELVFSRRAGDYFHVELKGSVSAALEVWAYTDAIGLCGLFRELASFDKPWKGERDWTSIERDFSVSVACSALGHVLFTIQLYGLAGAPEEWMVRVGLETEFGQLARIAKDAEAFFS